MKIAVIEDEKPIREGLVHILNKISPEYQVVGSAENGAEGRISAQYPMLQMQAEMAKHTDYCNHYIDGTVVTPEGKNLYKSDYSYSLLGFQLCEKSNRTGN